MCQGRTKRLAQYEVSAMVAPSEAVKGPLTRICGFVALSLVEFDCLKPKGKHREKVE